MELFTFMAYSSGALNSQDKRNHGQASCAEVPFANLDFSAADAGKSCAPVRSISCSTLKVRREATTNEAVIALRLVLQLERVPCFPQRPERNAERRIIALGRRTKTIPANVLRRSGSALRGSGGAFLFSHHKKAQITT
jgi:hypothetical protein